MSRKVIGSLLLASLLGAGSAGAWSTDVHTVICRVAWDLMSPDGRKLVSTVRKNAGVSSSADAFARSCRWPDSSRNKTHQSTYEYHFLNVRPDWRDAVDIDRDCPAFDCAPIAIIRYTTYLHDWTSSSKNERQKREHALRFLGHFVGDIHQPLHAGHRSDRGGNRINVRVSWGSGSYSSNLHSIWDGDIPEAAKVYLNQRAQLVKEAKAQQSSWQDDDAWQWAIDAYEDAKKYAYSYPSGARVKKGGTLEGDYLAAARPVARERVLQAAARLAHLIDLVAAGSNPYEP